MNGDTSSPCDEGKRKLLRPFDRRAYEAGCPVQFRDGVGEIGPILFHPENKDFCAFVRRSPEEGWVLRRWFSDGESFSGCRHMTLMMVRREESRWICFNPNGDIFSPVFRSETAALAWGHTRPETQIIQFTVVS